MCAGYSFGCVHVSTGPVTRGRRDKPCFRIRFIFYASNDETANVVLYFVRVLSVFFFLLLFFFRFFSFKRDDGVFVSIYASSRFYGVRFNVCVSNNSRMSYRASRKKKKNIVFPLSLHRRVTVIMSIFKRRRRSRNP